MAKKKETKLKKKLTTAQTTWISVAVLAAFAAVVLLCIWLFRPGPLGTLKHAAEKTMFAKNFTAVYELDVNGEKMDGLINASIDPEKKKLDVFLQFSSNEADYEGGIYNGEFVLCCANDDSLQLLDVSDQVEQFFTLVEKGEPDWNVLLNFSGFNLQESISKDFEFDVFMTCLGTWLNKLDSAQWAKENAGYTKTTQNGVTTYSYNPDPYSLVLQTIPMFKNAFRSETRYQDLQNYIESAQFLFKDGKADFSFSTESGQLVESTFHLKFLNTNISGTCSFIGIGSTNVDMETVVFYIDEAKGNNEPMLPEDFG